jgi:hypothetical protein
MKLFQILCFVLFSVVAFGQSVSLQKIEKDLARIAAKISSNYRVQDDTLEVYSTLFDKKINQYIKENPETLHYPFKILVDSNFCDVTTSSDKLFRIYSWDTWMGGTMHQFKNIYQYQSGEKIVSETHDTNDEEEDGYDPGTFCSAIYTLKAETKTYYLVITNGIYSTKDCSQEVTCYCIENGTLNNNVKLFKTSEGMTSTIGFSFDFFSVVDRQERPLKLIKYDEAKKLVYIPIVYENGKVTKRFITYKFNGQFFERVTTKKKGK